MKNVPETIYLQVDADGETPEDFKELEEVSWCQNKINENDLEYGLASHQQKLIEAYKQYIDLLNEEIQSLLPIAYVHGWKSRNFEKGKICRKRIAHLTKK